MNYVNEEHKQMAQRVIKDNDILYPVKSDKKSAVRAEYIQKLLNTPDFVKTYTANYRKMGESFKHIINHLTLRDFAIMMLFIYVPGVITDAYLIEKYNKSNKLEKAVSKKVIAKDFAILLLMVFGGLAVGTATAVAFRQGERENKTDDFYHHLILRYYDKLHKIDPETFDESVLRQCSPEMVRVIQAILIANMSEEDTKKLQNIALKTLSINDLRDYKNLKAFEVDISMAKLILEEALMKNPELYDVIKKSYTGYIPKTFVLNAEKQNVKE